MSVRPTASKIRQAFFNILGPSVRGVHFLDIFAGSGLMGFEALSRGAETLTLVEENRKMVRAIEITLRMLSYEAKIMAGDFRNVIPHLPQDSFDVIYADPPYKTTLPSAVLHAVDRHCVLKQGGKFAIEHAKGYEFPDDLTNLRFVSERFYGQTGLSFFERLPT